MDMIAMAQSERGAELVRQWNALLAESATSHTFDTAEARAAAFPDLLPIIMKLVPIVMSLLTSGFTPVALLALLPQLLKILLPNLDPSLLELLQKILAFFMGQ